MRTSYREASEPVPLSDIPEAWRTDHSPNGPFKQDGGVKQGYLFPVDDSFANRFIVWFGGRFPDAPVVLPAEANDSAIELLRRLLGQDIATLQGRHNRILDVQPPHVLVATERSPDGQQVPIADVQTALDALRTTGRVAIDPNTVGYRSSFIGAVLLTLPGVASLGGTPPVIAVRPLSASDTTTEYKETFTYEGDLSRPVTSEQRREQSALRRLLFGSAATAACALCGETYPVRFLVTAHIKMRSLCSDEERRDLAHVAMPACQFGCDVLYETGYIAVNQDGKIVATASETDGLLAGQLSRLAGRPCLSFTEDNRRYFEWHYAVKFRG
ncbi:hypothetical protein [Acrocarpospora catenulata]|uniref:hypothetical protein n=1 Tax=Acrocarpospora catenulata TaxID=2836182 RepID=UPI001BD93CFC|nr:hypothetical protein [Acrocarpospora catenulata]